MSSCPAAFVACHRLLLYVETHKSRCISLGGIADVEGGLWRSITMEHRLHFASRTGALQHWKLFKTAFGSSQHHQCLRATSVERFKRSPFGCLMAYWHSGMMAKCRAYPAENARRHPPSEALCCECYECVTFLIFFC